MTQAQKREISYNRFLTCQKWITYNYGEVNREQFKKLCEIWLDNNPEQKQEA